MVRGLEDDDRAALLVIECQRGVLDPELAIFPSLAEAATEREILGRIAALAGAWRSAGLPVVHVHVMHRPDFGGAAMTNPITAASAKRGLMVTGSAHVDAMPEVAPEPGDYVSVRHSGLGMWYGTDLDVTLRNLGVTTVVLTGVSTNIALFAGSIGAVDRGYHAVVVEDATAGADADVHEVMTTQTLPLLAAVVSTTDVLGALAPEEAASW